ncbi:MAG: hypothetical protein ACPLSN_03665 [Dictyoglomus turgidum]
MFYRTEIFDTLDDIRFLCRMMPLEQTEKAFLEFIHWISSSEEGRSILIALITLKSCLKSQWEVVEYEDIKGRLPTCQL